MAEELTQEKKERKISSSPTTPTKRPPNSPTTPPPTETRDGLLLIDVSLQEEDKKGKENDPPIIRISPAPTEVRPPSRASDSKIPRGLSRTGSPMKNVNGNSSTAAKPFVAKPQPFWFSLKNFLKLYGLAMLTIMLSWVVGTMGLMLTFDPQLLPFELASQLSSGLGMALLGVGAIMGAASLVYLSRRTGSIPNSLLFTVGLMAFSVTPHYWALQPDLFASVISLGPILALGAMGLVTVGFSLLWKNAEAHEVEKRYGVLLGYVEGNKVEEAKAAWDQFVHLYPNHAQEMTTDILSALSEGSKNSKDTTLEISYHFLTHPRSEKQSKQNNDKTAVTPGKNKSRNTGIDLGVSTEPMTEDTELCNSVSAVLADRAIDDPVQAGILLEKLYSGNQTQIIRTFKNSYPQQAVIAYGVLGVSKGGGTIERADSKTKNPLNPTLVAASKLSKLTEEESADVFSTLLQKKNAFLTQVAVTLQIQHVQRDSKKAVSNFAYLLEQDETNALALLDHAIKMDPKQTAGLIAETIDREGRAADLLVEALSTPGKTNQRPVMLFNLARYCPKWFPKLLTLIHPNELKPCLSAMVQEGCPVGQEVDFLQLLQVLIRRDQQIASYLLNTIINSRENIMDVTQRRNISTFIEHGTWRELVNENEEGLLKILELTLGREPNIDEFNLERIIALVCHLPENKSIEVLANLVIRLPYIRAQNQFLQELRATSQDRFEKVVAFLAQNPLPQTLTALTSFGMQDKEVKYSITAPKPKEEKAKASPPELPLLNEALQVIDSDLKTSKLNAEQIVEVFAKFTQDPRDIPQMTQAVALLLAFSKKNPQKAAAVFLRFCKTNPDSAAELLSRAGFLRCSAEVAELISRIVMDCKGPPLLHLISAMEKSGYSTDFLSQLSEKTGGVEQVKELIDTLIEHKGIEAAVAFAKNIASTSRWENSKTKFDLLTQLASSPEGLRVASGLIFEIPITINNIFVTEEEIIVDKDKKAKEKGSTVTEFLIKIYKHLRKQEEGAILIKRVISELKLSESVKFIFLRELAKRNPNELFGIIKADPKFCGTIDSILSHVATERPEEVEGFLNSIKMHRDIWVPLYGVGTDAIIISDSESISFQSIVKKYLPNKEIASPDVSFSSRNPTVLQSGNEAKQQRRFSMLNLLNFNSSSASTQKPPDVKQQKKSLTMRRLLSIVSSTKKNSKDNRELTPSEKSTLQGTPPGILTLRTTDTVTSTPSPSSAPTPVLSPPSTTAALLTEMSSSSSRSSNSPDINSLALVSSSPSSSPTSLLMFSKKQQPISSHGLPAPPVPGPRPTVVLPTTIPSLNLANDTPS